MKYSIQFKHNGKIHLEVISESLLIAWIKNQVISASDIIFIIEHN